MTYRSAKIITEKLLSDSDNLPLVVLNNKTRSIQIYNDRQFGYLDYKNSNCKWVILYELTASCWTYEFLTLDQTTIILDKLND